MTLLTQKASLKLTVKQDLGNKKIVKSFIYLIVCFGALFSKVYVKAEIPVNCSITEGNYSKSGLLQKKKRLS